MDELLKNDCKLIREGEHFKSKIYDDDLNGVQCVLYNNDCVKLNVSDIKKLNLSLENLEQLRQLILKSNLIYEDE